MNPVMARKREFDEDEALEKALALFHKQGYAATSMQDLVDHMGIGRGSLYETFGSKEELFVRALTRYAERSLADMVACLEAADDPMQGIRNLMHKVAETHAGNPDRSGCMVVNTIVELAPQDPAFAETFRSVWRNLEAVLEAALTRAQAEGRIGPERSPRALARFLAGAIQGLAVRGKYDPDRQGLRDVADTALVALA
jgi:TetR/AcrR family transcriptional repressor of nem operon